MVRILLLGAVILLCCSCGNERMREHWEDTRNVINKPFK